METKKTRGKNLTQAAVNQCIKELLDNNIEPTTTNIHKVTGGSYTTITKFLDIWKEENKEKPGSIMAIPDYVQEASIAMGMTWWANVQEHISKKLIEINKAADKRIEEFQKEREEFLESTDHYQKELKDEQQARQDERAQFTQQFEEESQKLTNSFKQEIKSKQQELTEVEKELAVEKVKVTDKKKEVTQLQAELETLGLEIIVLKQSDSDKTKLYTDLVQSTATEVEKITLESKSQQELLNQTFTQQNSDLKKTAIEAKNAAKKVEDALNKLLSEKDKLLSEKDARIAELIDS